MAPIEFPLLYTRGKVCLPYLKNVIEVGRPQSLLNLKASKNFDNYVVVVSQKQAEIDNPSYNDLFTVGTLCKIVNETKSKDHSVIIVEGIEKFIIKQFDYIESVDYVTGEVYEYKNYDLDLLRVKINYIYLELLEIAKRQPRNVPLNSLHKFVKSYNIQTITDIFLICYNYIHYAVSDFKLQQLLLEIKDAETLIDEVLKIVKKNIQERNVDEEIDSFVKEKMNDSQRSYYLNEKLKVIKDELNENGDDLSEIIEKLDNNPYPVHIKKKIKKEISKYESLPSSSQEANIIKTYIDTVLQIPWYQQSEDNDNLKLVKEVLDHDHFGLEKVKERIIEYLAVKSMSKSLKGPIICLVGPPGVGKTSLAKSIATSLNRKFVKVSLGGVKDESEIRGHRKTYLGAMPGRIITAMKKAETINPVFLLDEIDKMGYDYKGDPSAALLEVLDPEQNKYFSDNYIEEEYDLSNVLFIATANYLENIPTPLMDRLEIINLSSYTELEKVKIAINYLISKQIKDNGLKLSNLKISEAIILYLIRYYTREAGVRQLERLISTLCRKTCVEILNNDASCITVTKPLINKWLGKEKFDYNNASKSSQVGVVTGLAYTAFGGDTLTMEVNSFKGDGKLVVTGSLGDVMKESCKIALDYIKANTSFYGINDDFFKENDIHIHFPEGATPKDGPSAGVTITTALVSMLTNKKVDKNIAMTGEVTLRGNVLPIGGLKEKSLAAYRSGISQVFIPKENVKDLDDIPNEVKAKIEFIPVEKVNQIIERALI